MKEILKKALFSGLHGKHTHVSPEKALRGLELEQVTERPQGKGHSIFDLVYHMVFWHDLSLDAIHGKEIESNVKGKDWPPEDLEIDSTAWKEYKSRFFKGIQDFEEYILDGDLEKTIPVWGDTLVAESIYVIAQHNAYHLGQIVTIRQALGLWPPPE